MKFEAVYTGSWSDFNTNLKVLVIRLKGLGIDFPYRCYYGCFALGKNPEAIFQFEEISDDWDYPIQLSFDQTDEVWERTKKYWFLMKRLFKKTLLGGPEEPHLDKSDGANDPDLNKPDDGLTKAENEVLRLILDGKRNRQIAEERVVTSSTIASTIRNIRIAWGLEKGILKGQQLRKQLLDEAIKRGYKVHSPK